MQIHELKQRSQEWHSYRASHHNASDAPAVLSCSPYKTRSQLLHEMATGITPEIDGATQRRFDDGHRFEALARPLGETIVGEDFYPVVGSEGIYSASFDGLTMDESTAFEHKTLNDELRAAMVDGCTGADLPKLYRVQMEQQCMVSGCERVLFMASKWEGDNLVEERHCWYTPDAALRAELIAGWEQFERDLAAYTPPAVIAEVVGRTPEALPALRIEVTGKVTASNLDAFKEHALSVFGNLNRTLTTDQHFADAEKTVKWCGDVEDRLAAAKQHALSQTETIDALFRTIDEISAEARATRLELEKLVKARKEQIRNEIQQEGVSALKDHVLSLNERIGKRYMPPESAVADFGGAMKGKKTVASLRDAVATTLANAKIEANAIADRIQTNLNALRELAADHVFLFADTAQIVLKATDDCTALIRLRIAEHKATEEKRLADERARIAEEERVKAEAKARAEQEAIAAGQRQQAMLEAAQQRREAERMEPQPTPVAEAEKVVTILDNDPQFATASRPVPTIQPAVDTGARIRLGEINARIAPIAITAEGLAQLGYPHVETDKSAKLYRISDFPAICAAIARHVTAVAQELAQAA